VNPSYIEKLASIIRVADALDHGLCQIVDGVRLELSDNRLIFRVIADDDIGEELGRAKEKSDLLKEAFNLEEVEFLLMQTHKLRILFVCGGNTCRSPMAKVLLTEKLREIDKLNLYEVDSAAYDEPTSKEASPDARETVKYILGEDLLADHKAKQLTGDMAEQSDIILVMGNRMKKGLPTDKTWTLKEYAGGSGEIEDPMTSIELDAYLKCAQEISSCIDKIALRL